MSHTFKPFGILLILILIIAGAGCSPAGTGSSSDLPDIGPLQVGYVPVLTFAPFFIAYEKGYFAEQGLEVELHSFRNGPMMLSPLSTGQLDVSQGAMSAALFNAFHQDLDLKIVAGGPVSQSMSQTEMPLLVRKDLMDSGEVTTISDLAQRKIALNIKGATADYLLSQALASGGLTIEDVELVILPIPEIKTAFENGAVDASPIAYPLAGQFLQEQLAKPLIAPDELDGTFQFGGLFFGKRLLDPANREIGVRFLAAYLKAERELYRQQTIEDETLVEIIQQYTDLPPPAIKNSPLPTPVDGQIETELLTRMQTYFIQQGYTEFTEPIVPATMIDESYRAEALERLETASH